MINIQDVITFYGASVTELREEMQKSLAVYFEVCEEQRKVPDKIDLPIRFPTAILLIEVEK